MSRAVLIMSGVSALSAFAGVAIVTRRGRSEGAVYARRIAGTMAFALALILAIYAYGLARMGA